MKAKISLIIIILALVIVFIIVKKNSSISNEEVFVNNVSFVDGKQIIEIKAKGGYFPKKSMAKAGVPTILRINTGGTFDCSSFVRIPELNINQNLPQSGPTDLDLGVSKPGLLQGMCGMGMYPFEIEFQ